MKTTYYQTVYRRHNIVKEAILNFFLAFSSWPRMLLEVFIRRNMGERYFSLATAITLLVVLGAAPYFLTWTPYYGFEGISKTILVGKFLTWYGYLALFLYAAIQRNYEVKHLPSVFDFARFSLSTGKVDQRFFDLEFNGKSPSIRTVETVLEPALFFFIGFVLWLIGQPIGLVLLVSSIFYSLSYVAAYSNADNWLQDKIDEKICNEELVKTFTEDDASNNSRGFNFYGHRPADPNARRKLASMFMTEEEAGEII